MWLACFLTLIMILLWQVWSAGPRQALGVVFVLSFLFPSWLILHVAGLPIHLQAAAGLAGLAAFCIHPSATISWRLTPVDMLGLAFFGLHILSDWNADGVSLTVPLRAYGEWAVPLLAGRFALQNIDDVRKLLPYVVIVGVILASIAAMESVTGTNPAELIFGNRPMEQIPRDMSRLGLQRAFGTTTHPIYFGALQTLIFPWTLYAASRTQRGAGPDWWRWAPWFSVAGVFFTISRGPILALGVILYVTAVITKPAYRKILWLLVFVAIVAGVIGWRSILDAFNRWGGELRPKKQPAPTIVIDEQKYIYSGTLTRLYLFDVYSLAIRRAGWLGFGTARTTGFPVRVPVGHQHTETVKRLPWIDNAYILLILRFGYLGCAVFTMLGIASVVAYVGMINRPFARGIIFCAAAGGGLVASGLLLTTVWMPHDFGFWLLWMIGTSSGLSAHEQEFDDPSPQSPVSQ